MKNTLFTLVFTAAVSILSAQNFIDKHYSDLTELDRSTVIHVSQKSFELASYLIPANDAEEEAIKDFISNVNSLDVVSVPDYENAKAAYASGIELLEGKYEELLNVKDKENRISVFIDEENDIVYELVGIGYSEGEFFVGTITGEMKLEIIASVINDIDIDEIKPLKKLAEVEASNFEVYPNPAQAASGISVNIPDGMIGGKGTLFDINGAAVSSFRIENNNHKFELSNVAPGTYVVSLENEGVHLKRQVVVVR